MAQDNKSLGQLLAESFHLFKKNINNFIIIAAIVHFPLGIIYVVLFTGVDIAAMTGTGGQGLSASFMIGYLLYILVSIAASLLYQVVIIKAIHSAGQNEELDAVESYRKAFGLLLGYCVVMLWVMLKVFLWSLLFVIPGIIFSIFYSFAGMSFLLDGKKGTQALIFSKEIIKPNFWKFLGYTIVVLLIMVPFFMLIQFVAGFIFGSRAAGNFGFMPTAGEALVNLLTTVFSIYAMVFSYLLYKQWKPAAVKE